VCATRRARRDPRFALGDELGNIDVVKTIEPLAGAPARVARALLEAGPSTAPALAAQLGLTGTAVRRHLDFLVSIGNVTVSERAPFGPAAGRGLSRGRGRPAKIYSLNGTGRDSFEASYDDLAVGALRFLRETGGDAAVNAFAANRVTELERRYSAVMSATDIETRIAQLADSLSDDGYAASIVETPVGATVQICQHHCPVGHVASEFPELCDAEADAFSRLLGVHVTRLATIAAGDGICTTLVPTFKRDEVTPKNTATAMEVSV
jgi:predicted ArsR family transcriptional regulator